MDSSIAAIYARLALFITATIMFVMTFFFRRPGSKIFASISTVRQTYTQPGVICYWVAYSCLFAGIFLQLARLL